MTNVRFNIPTFMTGTLPSDGSTISQDITLIGTDGTTAVIKKRQNTIYNEKPTKHFIATMSSENEFPFQFVFPEKTLINSNASQFTTPSESVYIFSRVDGMVNNGIITKNVKGGTISITPPKQSLVTSNLDNVMNTGKAVELNVNTFVDNSVLLETALVDKLSKLKLIKDSPFYAILIILYKLAMDMIIVFIFWLLFISIICWLKVPSELLYPVDVERYPFVYYKPKKNEGDEQFNFLQAAEDTLCKPINPEEMVKRREKQATFFTELENLTPDKKNILKVIYPSLIEPDGKGVQKFASTIQSKCIKPELCTMDYITYFVSTLAFYNYLYCNATLGMIHKGCAFLSENVIGMLNKKITVVGFSALLYYMFLGVGAMNEKVRRKLKIELKDETEPKAILTNQLINLMVHIISCCVCLIIPLCTILVIVTLITTAYVLGKSCLFPINTTVLIIAFLTFFFSLSQYVYLIKKLAVTKMNPFDLIENMYAKNFSVRTLFSFLGITVPILFGLCYGCYIGFNLFFSAFRLLNIPEVSDMLKNTTASVVIVGLFLLLFHVRQTLGKSFSIMTFFIIILVGIYVMFKK